MLSIALVALAGTIVAPALGPAGAGPSSGPTSPGGRSYIEGVLGYGTNASPFGARTAADRILVALLFRGLVRLGPGASIVPDLAERWEVDSTGAHWTFHLRPDAVWQDGSPITSEDVRFTIAALSDPAYTGAGSASWREVLVTAPDPTTVELHLATPLGGFLQAATQPIAPAHLLAGLPPADLAADAFGRQPIGSGPFRIETFDAAHAVLRAWSPGEPTAPPSGDLSVGGIGSTPDIAVGGQPRPYLAGIELRFFGAAAALERAWQAGDLDAISGLPPDQLATFDQAAGSARIVRYPGPTLLAALPNLRSSHPALRVPAVRLALLQAIDRDRFLTEGLAGLGQRADAPIPPGSWAFDAASSPEVAFDSAAATAGLSAAGWKKTVDGWTPKGATGTLTIEILGPDDTVSPVAYAAGEAVARAWRAIGLGVAHVAVGPTELADRLRAGDFDVAVIAVNIGLDPDLYPLLASSQTTGARTNVLGLQDPTLDGLLAAARAAGSLEARKAAYVALQVRLAAFEYLLPLAYRDEVALVSNDLSGASIRPVGDAGGRFWDVLTWRLADGR